MRIKTEVGILFKTLGEQQRSYHPFTADSEYSGREEMSGKAPEEITSQPTQLPVFNSRP
jgi:hypothetical protein